MTMNKQIILLMNEYLAANIKTMFGKEVCEVGNVEITSKAKLSTPYVAQIGLKNSNHSGSISLGVSVAAAHQILADHLAAMAGEPEEARVEFSSTCVGEMLNTVAGQLVDHEILKAAYGNLDFSPPLVWASGRQMDFLEQPGVVSWIRIGSERVYTHFSISDNVATEEPKFIEIAKGCYIRLDERFRKK